MHGQPDPHTYGERHLFRNSVRSYEANDRMFDLQYRQSTLDSFKADLTRLRRDDPTDDTLQTLACSLEEAMERVQSDMENIDKWDADNSADDFVAYTAAVLRGRREMGVL